LTSNSIAISIHRLRLLAGRPALNFANTIDPRQGSGKDYLQTYADLAMWGARSGVLPQATADRLTQLGRRHPAEAGQALENALQLREAIYRVFSAIAVRHRASTSDLALVNAAFRDALAHAELEQYGQSFRWRLDDDLQLVRWNVARDAVSLLESGLLRRVKRCPGVGNCGWVFFDESKNCSRRWCSMEGCGNRAKMRRHAGSRNRF